MVERKMNAMDSCCYSPVHFDTCNWDDGGNSNNTAQWYLDANCAFPICLGKCDAQGDRIHQPGSLRVAVKKICMVLLVHNHRLFSVVAVSVATLAVAVAVVPVAVVAAAVAPYQLLQSFQIGVVSLTDACQVELVLAVSH
jgi:hypothetical protein